MDLSTPRERHVQWNWTGECKGLRGIRPRLIYARTLFYRTACKNFVKISLIELKSVQRFNLHDALVLDKDFRFGFRVTLGTKMETAAVNILKRAVEMDEKRRYTEAMVCYQEGIQLLIDSIKSNLIKH